MMSLAEQDTEVVSTQEKIVEAMKVVRDERERAVGSWDCEWLSAAEFR